jgi:hypothetical protein
MIDSNNASNFGQCNFHFCRVILDPTNADYSQAALSVPFVDANNKINLPSVRNEGNFSFEIDANTGLAFTYNGSLTCVACAVIVSRKMNDKWLRSTAYLTYNGQEEYSMGDCIDAAAQGSNGTIYAAADAYLNNAGQGGGQAASASDPGSDVSGGGGSLTPAISSATFDGNSMVMGTAKVVTYPNGTTFPLTKTVAAQASASAIGKYLSIRANGTEVASAPISNTSVSVSHAWAKDTIYQLTIVDENDQILSNTGFSFRLAESSGNGSGGFDSEGE